MDRAELADELVESATSADDPLRAMGEMIADFVMQAEMTVPVTNRELTDSIQLDSDS